MDLKEKVLESFIPLSPDTEFSMYNLPYGIFQSKGWSSPRVGVAIGDYVLDLALLEETGLLKTGCSESLFNQDSLNLFASHGIKLWSFVRKQLQSLLAKDCGILQDSIHLSEALYVAKDVQLSLPFKIGGYTDFYASEHHASNVGKLLRGGDHPLFPNWKYLPVAYNGRASTVFLSGTEIKRPSGQMKPPTETEPFFSATKKLDFELELGIFVGVGNAYAQPISVTQAKSHLFGLVLLNDWSARDIQAFEYQPLGPFLGKSFATSISPWVVPFEALEAVQKSLPEQEPRPVDYLYAEERHLPELFLRVELQPEGSKYKTLLCETKATELYWSFEQMLAHHSVNGCIMQSGDLLGSGTISGEAKTSWGSLLELTFNGREHLKLNGGYERTFLQDGDLVIMSGYAKIGEHKIGFGHLEGRVKA